MVHEAQSACFGLFVVQPQRHLGGQGEVAMTMENEESVQPANEVDAAQQTLDAEQGNPATPQYATVEQIQNLEKIITSQTSGLQSKIDTGLNAIRRDAEERVAEQASSIRNQQLNELMEDLAPEQQAQLKRLWSELKQAVQQPVSGQLTDQEREQAQRIARNAGADPNDARIDYASLIDPSLTEDQRQQKFFESIYSIRTTPAPAAQPPVAAQPQQPQTANPPVEAPAGTGNGLNNVDAVRDAYISGRLDQATYKQRMAALGQPVQ